MGQQLAQLERDIPKSLKQVEMIAAQANRYYKVRNWLLGLGFVGLLISRIIVPYFPK